MWENLTTLHQIPNKYPKITPCKSHIIHSLAAVLFKKAKSNTELIFENFWVNCLRLLSWKFKYWNSEKKQKKKTECEIEMNLYLFLLRIILMATSSLLLWSRHFRTCPKEPFPITSRTSNLYAMWSCNTWKTTGRTINSKQRSVYYTAIMIIIHWLLMFALSCLNILLGWDG